MARMKKDVFTGPSRSSSSSDRHRSIKSISSKGCQNVQQQQQHQDDEEEEENQQPFSFPRLLKIEDDEKDEANEHGKSREMYIDMDIALPCAWESMKRQGSSKSSSVDSQEFDFSKSLRGLDPACETPADELFYKGQLLPLHSKIKLEDNEDEEDDEEQEDGEREEQEEDAKADSFSFKAQGGFLKDLDLGCLSPDRFPTRAEASACGLVDSRSSSFRSSSSYWDSGDKDSGDSSSSCRDSNGSSQDSCFEAPSSATTQQGTTAIPAVASDPGKLDQGNKKKQSSGSSKFSSSPLNWRKSPFKWKVFLGGSKRVSLSASSSCSSTSSASSTSRGSAAFNFNDRRRNHSFTFGSSASTSSSGPLLGSFFTGSGSASERPRQQHYRHSVSSTPGTSGRNFQQEHSAPSSQHSSFRDLSSSSPGGTSSSGGGGNSSSSNSSSNKATEVLHKYLKLIKEKVSSNSNTGAPTFSSPYYYSSYSQKKSDSNYGPFLPPSAATRAVSGSSGSLPRHRSLEEWRAAITYYDQQREQHDKELITCPSFLPGSLRVSSFSSRRSSTHASCVTSSRSSPNHSGVLKQCADGALHIVGNGGGSNSSSSGSNSSSSGSSNGSSSMSDLQSAIQGAIAHCKKSQTSSATPVLLHHHHNFLQQRQSHLQAQQQSGSQTQSSPLLFVETSSSSSSQVLLPGGVDASIHRQQPHEVLLNLKEKR